MKIRNGFVSNSSSSSFIVSFPHIPKDTKDLKDMMFPNGEELISYYSDSVSVTDIVEAVYREIQDQVPNDSVRLFELMDDTYDGVNPYYVMDNYVFLDANGNVLPVDKMISKEYVEFVNELNNNKDKVMFHFEFSDNDGRFWTVMEHGNIFCNLEHHRINHH